ncbi:Uncharacterised protein [Yersinia similis]|nr:Uncharacterised protein [Yersinia similis]CNE22237.1 Uncharacterised protein [Yersinia similis]
MTNLFYSAVFEWGTAPGSKYKGGLVLYAICILNLTAQQHVSVNLNLSALCSYGIYHGLWCVLHMLHHSDFSASTDSMAIEGTNSVTL